MAASRRFQARQASKRAAEAKQEQVSKAEMKAALDAIKAAAELNVRLPSMSVPYVKY